MKILAIDQSLVSSGYVIIEDDKIINKGTYKPKTKGVERLIDIRNKVIDLIDYCDVNFIVMEDYSYGSRGRATFSLGELGGVLKTEIKDTNYYPYTVPIGLWKKYITGAGNTKKDMILMKVYKKYGHEFKDNNICDAFCIGKFFFDYMDWSLREKDTWYNKHETECFKKYNKYLIEKVKVNQK